MDELTPVEKYRDNKNDITIWAKRDDYFQPFDDFKVCGGKVRQCMSLLSENQKYIETECDLSLIHI